MGIYHRPDSENWWGSFKPQGQKQVFFKLDVTYRGLKADKELAEEAFYKKREEIRGLVEAGKEINSKISFGALVDEFLDRHVKTGQRRSCAHIKLILRRWTEYFGATSFSTEFYACSGTAQTVGGRLTTWSQDATASPTASAFRIQVKDDAANDQDAPYISIMCFGDY